MAAPSWVPLHVHSQYSVLDALASIDDLAKKAADYKIPALALTDHGNLYGAVEFFKACKAVQVKPIIGCEVYVAPGKRTDKQHIPGGKTAHHLVLLAKNKVGYHNLCKLSSQGFLEGFYYNPRIDHELLEQHSEGLICLSACLSGLVPQTILSGDLDQTIKTIQWYKDLFKDDYYLELQRHQMSEEFLREDGYYHESWLKQNHDDFIDKQKRVNEKLIQLSKELNIPLVATNDIHYIERSDWYPHEVLLNVQSGEACEIVERDSMGNPKERLPNPKRRVYASHELYFKSPEAMRALFKDVPEAIDNTLLIAEKCQFEFDFKTKHYPVYVPPSLEGKQPGVEERAQAVQEFLTALCEEGIKKRYTEARLQKVKEQFPDKEPMEVVRNRLKYELDLIISKGMADYLLIVYDFINWAKRNGIPVGPGRGSGAGSIILYLIGVTDIEPLRFSLFFERFINPERISYPDIDVDICMDRRQEVIEYTQRKYGASNVAQIITFGTMKAKMVVRDVGRVLSVPLSQVNSLAKLIPEDPNMTIEKALEIDPELNRLSSDDVDAKRIIEIGKRLEGAIRSTGIHAAGIIISDKPITDHIPVCLAKESDIAATQFSMKPVEAVGLLKIDFLGLKTLTCIKKTVDAIQRKHDKVLDWVDLPLDDPGAFSVLNQGLTVGIFQMESGGMQELAKHLHLDKFEEIIAVGALYRPGPMDMIPSFINRKHGREPIEYDHPWMQEILSETYGIMVYQEQVMQIAQRLANYSLGEGDVLRRAMGKKDAQAMAEQREKFRIGALANGIDETLSMQIFDKMEKFASYGFNKSHAAAYGYLTYVTAYLKANYPKEWMAALMTCDQGDITKVAKFIRESQDMQIAILPPDVNESRQEFEAVDKGIRFALSAIKGIGLGVVEAILEERKERGHFKGLYDFCERLDPKKVTKKNIEILIQAGCFDFTGWSRDALLMSVEPMYESAQLKHKERAQGIMTFFALMGDQEDVHFDKPPQVVKATAPVDILFKEKELLGLFLTGHPMDIYKNILERLSCVPLSEVEKLEAGTAFRAAFIVDLVQIRFSKQQRKFAILEISDGHHRFELPIWSDLYEEKASMIGENKILYAVLQADRKEGELKLQAKWVGDLSRVDEKMVEECDQAYDRAKFMQNRFSQASSFRKEAKPGSSSQPNGAGKGAEKVTIKTLKIIIDADTSRLSHVIMLKNILRKHPGPCPVHIDFKNLLGKSLGLISINTPWGVVDDPKLIKSLKEVATIKEIGYH